MPTAKPGKALLFAASWLLSQVSAAVASALGAGPTALGAGPTALGAGSSEACVFVNEPKDNNVTTTARAALIAQRKLLGRVPSLVVW
ncbi:unannotated protein [freshwater metagenome]|uniref:Unannotated protein n=1 Tax=freshwater metagenome TaxID=449393 RepID=A0A6J6AYC5_9ZZZZ